MNFKIQWFLLMLLIPATVFANNADTSLIKKKNQKLKPRKKMKIAADLVEKGSYYNAIAYYEDVYKTDPTKIKAADQLGQLNYMMRDYKSSAKWYKEVVDSENRNYPMASYWYAMSLKLQGKYDQAITQFEAFKSDYDGDDASAYKKMAETQIEGCKLGQDQMNDPIRVKVDHLDDKVNQPFTEFAPRPYKDELVFSSLRSDSAIAVNLVDADDDYKAKIFSSTMSGDAWAQGMEIEGPVNDPEFHNGNACYSPDGTKMYFTRCTEGDQLQMECEIYVSKKVGGKWSDPELVGGDVNMKNTNNTHPYVSYTGEGKEVLYFTSNRDGGKGGNDIWYAIANSNGKFSSVKNMGNEINTSGNEITPFYDLTNKVFYFSSDGHPGIGGFDIFKSEGDVDGWTSAVNVGYPLNSSVDDIYLALTEDGNEGYFISNRPGGYSLKSETCCDDIWKVNFITDVILKGYVTLANDPDKKPVAGANVNVDINYGGNYESISTFKTGEDEFFLVPLEPGSDYKIKAIKDGYIGEIKEIKLSDMGKVDTVYEVLYLKAIMRLRIKKVFFAFDKSDVRMEYKTTLDSIFLILDQYPDFKLQITGHTDAKGSDSYNMSLGERRAKSGADYLVSKGIDPSRIEIFSKGESEPIAPNSVNGKDNPDGRAKNRRIEFKIITDNEDIDIIYVDNEPKSIE